jgi:hydrogenase maturation protein HypF
MQHYHIHIKGIVQGVGFRPFVHRLAGSMGIQGWVSNSTDGVHIGINAEPETAQLFYRTILRQPPANAVITEHHITEQAFETYHGFSILQSAQAQEPDLLLTPDIAICDSCRKEIHDPNNRRYGYAFTTCLNCGPRYSITHSLPYDREHTTMASQPMCPACEAEYRDVESNRYHSQTNSCPDCRIRMILHGFALRDDEIPSKAAALMLEGKILAVKGIGGYLLMCDATNADAIRSLREKKNRPSKPLALLFPDMESLRRELTVRPVEEKALTSKYAPIVLLAANKSGEPLLEETMELIAPGLEKLGAMLPNSPLLELIAHHAQRPLIATSGNLSGSPIIFRDDEALEHLSQIADHVLSYDREILTPQDDPVIQYNEKEQRIILRRGRGLSPNYLPSLLPDEQSYLAMGAELKSAFAIQHKKNLYISQYLGNQESLESQDAYKSTLKHFSDVLHVRPKTIIVDKHPNYQVSEYGRQLHQLTGAKLLEVQHHEAHFAALLAEHRMLDTREPILGFIWDGTGYGNDGQVWGSESFVYRDGKMERLAHLKYFPQLLGDKMSREPRLSALALLHNFHEYHGAISRYFTPNEWALYHKLLAQENALSTSSMGRFLDAIACILGICTHNTYEGEAALQLEALALNEQHRTKYSYSLPLVSGVLDWDLFIEQLMHDVKLARSRGWIALKVFNGLADAIAAISEHHGINKLAFSGGVFQNAYLTSLLQEKMNMRKQLYFHRQLSPNDENIGLGQLALAHIAHTHSNHPLNNAYVPGHPR